MTRSTEPMPNETIIVGAFDHAAQVAATIEADKRVRVAAIVRSLKDAESWVRAGQSSRAGSVPRTSQTSHTSQPERVAHSQRLVIVLEPAPLDQALIGRLPALHFRRRPFGRLERVEGSDSGLPETLRPLASRITVALESLGGTALASARFAAAGLTPREQQVLTLLCTASSNACIARELGLSVGTVKNYVTRLFQRLGVEKRSEAILRGIELTVSSLRPVRRVAVAAWIDDGTGRVLLHRETLYGAWSLPGGRVEIGETIKQALRREVSEETGLEISVGSLIGVYSNPEDQRHADGEGTSEYVTIYARGLPNTPQPVLLNGAQFFSLKQIESLTLAPMSPHWLEDALGNFRHPVWR